MFHRLRISSYEVGFFVRGWGWSFNFADNLQNMFVLNSHESGCDNLVIQVLTLIRSPKCTRKVEIARGYKTGVFCPQAPPYCGTSVAKHHRDFVRHPSVFLSVPVLCSCSHHMYLLPLIEASARSLEIWAMESSVFWFARVRFAIKANMLDPSAFYSRLTLTYDLLQWQMMQ